MSKKITFATIARNEAIWDILEETRWKDQGPLGIFMAHVERDVRDHFFFLFDHSQPKVIKDTLFVRLHSYVVSWTHMINKGNDTENGTVPTHLIEDEGIRSLRDAHNALVVMSGEIRKRYDHDIYEEYLYTLIKPLGFKTFKSILECGPLKEHEDTRRKVTSWLLYKEGERKSFL